MNRTEPTRARGVAALFASLALASAVLTIGASPASAHDQLLQSNPAENTVLDSAPSEITLTYSDSVLTVGAIVMLVDEDQKNWVHDDPILDGPTVTALVNGELPDGAYEIRWRVVSIDGHPISGIIPFTIGDAEPAPRASMSSSPSDEPSNSPEASASSNTRDDTMRPVLIGIGGAAAALLLFWAAIAWNRYRRRPRRTNSASGMPSP